MVSLFCVLKAWLVQFSVCDFITLLRLVSVSLLYFCFPLEYPTAKVGNGVHFSSTTPAAKDGFYL